MKIPMDRDTPNTLISIAFLQHPTQIAASDMTCVVYSNVFLKLATQNASSDMTYTMFRIVFLWHQPKLPMKI